MKKLTYTLASLIALTFAQSALASDGEITINGEVIDETCTIDGNGTGASDFTVTLPTVNTFNLEEAGQTIGDTPFTLDLTACPDTATSVTAWFEESNVDQATGNLVNNAATPAENVQVELLTKNSDAIDLTTNTTKDNGSALPEETITSGAAQLQYFARYIAVDGAATAGDVETKATYSLSYN